MFSPAVILWLGSPPFIFLLDKLRRICYNIEDEGGSMNSRLWLAVDSALRKLQNANHWVTSVDKYKEDIEAAIAALKEAKRKIEAER